MTKLTAASYRAMGKNEPVEFEREDGTAIKIPRPDGATMFDVEDAERRGTAGTRDLLRMICGDAGAEVVAEVSGWPIEGVQAFVRDLMEQFGMGESAASSG